MNQTEKPFDPGESLKLISSMIESTRYSLADSSHFYLMWGYTVMLGCCLQYLLMVVFKYPNHPVAWSIMFIAIPIHLYFVHREKKKQKVETFISDAYGIVWMSIGMAFFVLCMILAKIGFQYCFPFFILMYALGTFISGSLIKFKWLQLGGGITGVLAIVCAYLPYEQQILVTALAILISYIIPGHLLRMASKSNRH